MRDVTIDELFSWKDEFSKNAAELLGRAADVNPMTYLELKGRCEEVVRRESIWARPLEENPPLNSLIVHVVTSIPDGILRRCGCARGEIA